MKPAIKTKWLKALRGGRYKQAKGTLRNDRTNAMCCLGVLAHVQGADWKKIKDRITPNPPIGMRAGVSANARSKLAAMNDGSYCSVNGQTYPKHSFKQIADYIEKYL